jgi:hypothetical protein
LLAVAPPAWQSSPASSPGLSLIAASACFRISSVSFFKSEPHSSTLRALAGDVNQALAVASVAISCAFLANSLPLRHVLIEASQS